MKAKELDNNIFHQTLILQILIPKIGKMVHHTSHMERIIMVVILPTLNLLPILKLIKLLDLPLLLTMVNVHFLSPVLTLVVTLVLLILLLSNSCKTLVKLIIGTQNSLSLLLVPHRES